jgi:probable rRNA maturation factor
MIDVEVFGSALTAEAPTSAEIQDLCIRAGASAGIDDGHVAIEFVDAQRITELNAQYRARPRPTDVLSFPIDGVEPASAAEETLAGAGPTATQQPPRELGDIVICPQHTADLGEAIVHGMLHLLGMDHETDDGEMLALQRRLLAQAGR